MSSFMFSHFADVVERLVTMCTQMWLFSGVNKQMRFQFILSFEFLLALRTIERLDISVYHDVTI